MVNFRKAKILKDIRAKVCFRLGSYLFSLLFLMGFSLAEDSQQLPAKSANVSGELKKWHKVTFSWVGPETSEVAKVNPFADYRLDVVFAHSVSGKTYTVPGYYAADGDSANTSAVSGNIWRVHFAPDEVGDWSYTARFRQGKDVAVLADVSSAESAKHFDGDTGQVTISPSDKTGRDHRAKGRLEYVGKHHLQFAETKEYFLKVGPDAPENFLAYDDFDDTPNDQKHRGDLRKSWELHQKHYDAAEAVNYTWSGGKGTEMLGAVNYLASKGLNAFSFLTFSLDGDDDNVFPHRLAGSVADYESIEDNRRWKKNAVYHDRFDVSKLAQWENILEYADTKGLFLHFKTQETENEEKMDDGAVGRERKLYYRELIARFSHHLALNWNLGEENNDQSVAERKAMAEYFHTIDPYNHLVVIHSYPNKQAEVYEPLLGEASHLTGASVQTNKEGFTHVFGDVLKWVKASKTAGKPWVVSCDEPGDAKRSLRPAGDEGKSWINGRKNALWGSIMAGGAGVEFYFGYKHAHSDLTCQDYASRDGFWDFCRIAIEFFQKNDVPFYNMQNAENLSSSSSSWCLTDKQSALVVYLKQGGITNLDLSGYTGDFNISWYDPRNGGELQQGSVQSISGGKTNSLGTAPNSPSKDWVVLVRK